MVNLAKNIGLSTLVLSGVMAGSAFAQTAAVPQGSDQSAAVATDPVRHAAINPDDASTYATGKPLQSQSKEGFWGHMNPFARKKWVAREVDPVKDRANELDQLQSKNANDIRDVDSRAKAGIDKAMMAANTADAHAADAAGRATAAQSTATGASTRTDTLNGTVSNLDQYQSVISTSVPFAAGHTALGPQGKLNLDEMAAKLAGEKGYIVEVQGYSKGGNQASQAMADSVVRYLVTEHQVPLYRIYRTGLGKQAGTPADGQTTIANGVRVTLLHNSLAAMGSSASNTSDSTTMPSQSAGRAPGVNQ